MLIEIDNEKLLLLFLPYKTIKRNFDQYDFVVDHAVVVWKIEN